jgi:hypothetical protein
VIQGARARVPLPVLAAAALLLIFRTAISAIPLAGAAAADIFTAHRWAAALIVRAIDRQLGLVTPRAGPGQWGRLTA